MEDTRTTDTADSSSSSRIDLFSVVGAGVLWGTGGLAGAMLTGQSGIDPLAVAGYRLAIGGGLVVAWLLMTGELTTLRLGGPGCRRLLVIGVLAAWFQSCYFAAVSLTSVSLATLVTLGAAPVVVVVAESVVRRRRPSARITAAIVLAVAGLVLLVGSPSAAEPKTVIAGTLCALASAGGFAAITMLGARPVDGLRALPLTGLAFCLGGVITLPLAALAGRTAVSLEFETLALLAYLGLAPTAVAYALYFTGLRTMPTGSAALIALVEPLTAAVLGAALLGERLGAVGASGAALIGLAVVMTSVRPAAGSD